MQNRHLQFRSALLSTWTAAFCVAFASTGCSTAPTHENGDKEAATGADGPAVVYARTEPGTVELNREFRPTGPAEVLADIKDFTSRIKSVTLKFAGIPLEIPMENIGGSVWRAQLTPTQLEMLAVSGRTVRYEAHVVAQNEEGKTASTQVPVEVAIRTPEIVTGSG